MFATQSRSSALSRNESKPGVAKPRAEGRQSNPVWQRLATRVQPKLTISAPDDPYEREADAVADRIMRMPEATIHRSCAARAAGAPPCPKSEEEEQYLPTIHRKVQSSSGSEMSVPDEFLSSLGPGQPLDAATRAFLEPRFGRDFSAVRIHTDGGAAASARAIRARAYTAGSNLVFGEGEYTPHSSGGQRLLAHELTHVVQQSSLPMSRSQVQRQASHQSITPSYAARLDEQALEAEINAVRQALMDPSTPPLERDGLQENLTVLEDEVRSRNRPASAPSSTGNDLDSRIAAFKQLVLSAARSRLADNRGNLAMWRSVVAQMPLTERSARQIQAAQIQQTVGRLGVSQWDVNRCLAETNPIRREIYCGQLEGRYRACTGCHLEQRARQLDLDTGTEGRTAWSSLAMQITGIPDFRMLGPGPSQAQMGRFNEITEAYRSIIAALGPSGFQVWPDSFVSWDSPDVEAIRLGILSRIDRRQADYLELMRMISNGEREYFEFEPVLQELLPMASPDVQQAIREEMESRRRRGIVTGIVTGIAAIGLLLLTIFPPTTAIGVAGFAALEMGMSAYAVASGVEMLQQGSAYGLARGTTDVYSPEQQSAAEVMMFMGVLNVATGPFAAYTGAIRGVGAVGRIAEAGMSAALTPAAALSRGSSIVFGTGESTSLASDVAGQAAETSGPTQGRQITIYHGTSQRGFEPIHGGRIDVAASTGPNQDFSLGFYVSEDLAVAEQAASSRNLARSGGMQYILRWDIPESELGMIVDIRPGGAQRQLWERFLAQPPGFAREIPGLAGRPGFRTNLEYLEGFGIERRGTAFEEFLTQNGLQNADVVMGDIGGPATTGAAAPPGGPSTQIVLRTQRIADKLNQIITTGRLQ